MYSMPLGDRLVAEIRCVYTASVSSVCHCSSFPETDVSVFVSCSRSLLCTEYRDNSFPGSKWSRNVKLITHVCPELRWSTVYIFMGVYCSYVAFHLFATCFISKTFSTDCDELYFGYGANFDFRQELRIFLFFTASRPVLGPAQPPIQRVPAAFTPGVKRPGREADHSPPSNVEAKNTWCCTSTPPYVFIQ
jgi:hypothetical protein